MRPRPRPLQEGRRPRAEAPAPELSDAGKARRAARARLRALFAEPWEKTAECVRRRLDPNLFFPEPGAPISALALSACFSCQVRPRCLRRAMAIETDGHREGIWGGLTERQRTELAAGRKVRLLPPSARNKGRTGARAAAKAARQAGTAGSPGRRTARSRTAPRAKS